MRAPMIDLVVDVPFTALVVLGGPLLIAGAVRAREAHGGVGRAAGRLLAASALPLGLVVAGVAGSLWCAAVHVTCRCGHNAHGGVARGHDVADAAWLATLGGASAVLLARLVRYAFRPLPAPAAPTAAETAS